MTPQEAIKNIEIAIAEVEWEYPMQYAVAFETAIKALEKQIPKKPVDYDSKIKVGFCPDCEAVVTSDFCDNCGQALDWSADK